MKAFSIASAFGIAHLASLAVATGPPYSEAFERLCGNGETSGTFQVDGTTAAFSYFCNTGQSVGNNDYVTVRSAEICADICESLPRGCNSATWDQTSGRCWRGQGLGERISTPGQVLLVNDPLSACEQQLDKYRPVDPVCSWTEDP